MTPKQAAPGAPSNPGMAKQRLQAQRNVASAQAARRRQRQRLLMIVAPIAAVLVVLVALVAVKLGTGSGDPKSGTVASAADNDVVTRATSVPAGVLNTIGTGSVATLPKSIAGTAAKGLPYVLYVGAEYCPFCAAEQWGLVGALSRFGTFANLGQTASSPTDVYPSTSTFSFHGATYTSKYLAFTGKETMSNQVLGSSYAPLDPLDAAELSLAKKFNPSGSIPFLYIDGKYSMGGASYGPAVLHGKTHAQIAAALSDPSSAIALGVDGTANVLTAALCSVTGGSPAAVCSAPGVAAATARVSP